MLINILMLVLGIGSLYLGGEWLVKSAARLASSFGASVLVIGLTVVAKIAKGKGEGDNRSAMILAWLTNCLGLVIFPSLHG